MTVPPFPRVPVPGWRVLRCNQCPTVWLDWSRDSLSPSGAPCPACGDEDFGHGLARPATREELLELTERGLIGDAIGASSCWVAIKKALDAAAKEGR